MYWLMSIQPFRSAGVSLRSAKVEVFQERDVDGVQRRIVTISDDAVGYVKAGADGPTSPRSIAACVCSQNVPIWTVSRPSSSSRSARRSGYAAATSCTNPAASIGGVVGTRGSRRRSRQGFTPGRDRRWELQANGVQVARPAPSWHRLNRPGTARANERGAPARGPSNSGVAFVVHKWPRRWVKRLSSGAAKSWARFVHSSRHPSLIRMVEPRIGLMRSEL